MTLNESAMALADVLADHAGPWRCAVSSVGGARIVDCGGAVGGGLQAGLQMARVCTAGLADVSLQSGPDGPEIQLATDDPVRACLASQYAGWQIKGAGFFAMGSGPMRAAAAREALFEHIPGKEQPPCAVGVLETRKHPTDEIISYLVNHLPATAEKLTLLVAPPSSMAGTVQVVARALETALHKLHELKFDLHQVVSGYGVAPLPPVAPDEGRAIGWTNDAILYGGRVVLWVRADDELLHTIGQKVPSSASPDHGAPFADIFHRYNGDFYKIDPLLFSPAVVEFRNLKTGKVHRFGRTEPDLLRRSFGG
jgi:methenyltetrahydromethanopterin cyclohydrolase